MTGVVLKVMRVVVIMVIVIGGGGAGVVLVMGLEAALQVGWRWC